MGLTNEFKKFVARGNVVDLAVGVIIGAAFNDIVQSLVKDILMPVFSFFMGKVNVKELSLLISPGGAGASPIEMKYGLFLQSALDFLILAMCVFFMVKFFNRYMKKAEDPQNKTAPTPKDIQLLSEIRDLLKEKSI